MKRSPKKELFEDGLQSGTFGKRRFSVLVWTRIFLKTDKKKLRFQTKTDTRVYKAFDAIFNRNNKYQFGKVGH